jgi:hypothetical protein
MKLFTCVNTIVSIGMTVFSTDVTLHQYCSVLEGNTSQFQATQWMAPNWKTESVINQPGRAKTENIEFSFSESGIKLSFPLEVELDGSC